ncbi:MAG: hypothetical protein R2834_01900 [Rhodothermales bacterium]
MKRYRFVPIVLLALVSLRCEHAQPFEPEPLPQAPALADIQTSVFSVSCAVQGCHAGANAIMGLDLSEGLSHANIVNVPSVESPDLMLVKPGDPDNSYLVAKIEGSALVKAGTFRMPLGREPLSDDVIQAVREWIEAGAKND